MDKAVMDIAGKLGIAFEEAVPLLARYVMIDAWFGIIFCVLIIIMVLYTLRKIWYYPDYDNDENRNVMRLFCSIVAGILIMIFMITMFDGFSRTIEPRGYLIYKVMTGLNRK